MRAPDDGYRRDIQGLRAVAVILVIGCHLGIPGFAGGFVGVDIFFVVSGFVITNLLLREVSKGPGVGLADFYCRRILRIVPAATVTLVGTLIATALVLTTHVDPHLSGDVRWASLFAANWRLIFTGSSYFVQGVHPSVVTQFWSLAVEEQFYLAYPLVVFLVTRIAGPSRHVRALTATLGVMVATSFLWSIVATARDPVSAYYSPLTRFWELGLGCLLATVTVGRPIRTARSERLAVGVGSALLVIALVELGPASSYPGWRAALPCASTALVIWSGVGGARTSLTRLLSTRWLGCVGGASFALYLVHYPLIEIASQLSPVAGWHQAVVEVGATVVVAMALHRFVENPVRRSRRLVDDRLAVVLILVLGVAASWTAATALDLATHLT